MAAIVYQALNMANGHRYVGVTCRGLSLRQREHIHLAKRGRGYLLGKAIRKYGETAFVFTMLAEFPSLVDAMLKEIEIIEELRPEYNLARGGQAVMYGRRHSADSRAKMTAIRKANPQRYWLGKKRSQTTIDKIVATKASRDYGPPSEKALAVRRENQKAAAAVIRRPIICLTDDIKFISVNAAVAHYGLNKGNIVSVCRGRYKRTGGKVFAYLER